MSISAIQHMRSSSVAAHIPGQRILESLVKV